MSAAATPSWRSSFEAQFRAANSEPSAFRELVIAHGDLQRRHAALRAQQQQTEKQLMILQHEHRASSGGKAVQQLEEQIMDLQSELVGAERGAREGAELKYRALAAETTAADATRALEAVEAVEKQVRAERDAILGSEQVLRQELEQCRVMLSQREAECETLRAENSDMMMRLLEDKASLVGEMNAMNEVVEKLTAANAALQRDLEEANQGSGAKPSTAATASAPSGNRLGAGGIEKGGGGNASGSGVSGGWTLGCEVCTPPSKLRFTTRAHHSEANAVGYSKVDPILFTADSSGSVKVWEAATGRAKATLRGADQALVALDSHDNLLAVASVDRTVKVWDLRTERLRQTITGHVNKVHSVKFSGDGRLLVSGSSDRTIKVWDACSGREVRTLKSSSTVNALDLSAEAAGATTGGGGSGGCVVSGHQDGSLKVWDLGTGALVGGRDHAHAGQVTSCCFSPRGGMRVLTAGRDHALGLWDARALAATRSGGTGSNSSSALEDLPPPLAILTHSGLRLGYNWSRAVFSPDGAYVGCGSLNGTVLVWDLAIDRRAASSRRVLTSASSSSPPASSGNSSNSNSSSGNGGGWGLRAALGGAVEKTLGRTSLGNTLGQTIGGGLGNHLRGGEDGGHAAAVPEAWSNETGGLPSSGVARCHAQLRSHEAAVTNTAWAPGVGGWQQMATVDKAGQLCLWD